jgi:hypothetical protein
MHLSICLRRRRLPDTQTWVDGQRRRVHGGPTCISGRCGSTDISELGSELPPVCIDPDRSRLGSNLYLECMFFLLLCCAYPHLPKFLNVELALNSSVM